MLRSFDQIVRLSNLADGQKRLHLAILTLVEKPGVGILNSNEKRIISCRCQDKSDSALAFVERNLMSIANFVPWMHHGNLEVVSDIHELLESKPEVAFCVVLTLNSP